MKYFFSFFKLILPYRKKQVNKYMKYLMHFISDKLLYLFSFINNKVDLTKTYRFSNGKKNSGENIDNKIIWEEFMVSINLKIEDIDVIYFLQFLMYSEESLKKVEYLIKCKFWSYLEFYDEDYFPKEFLTYNNQLGSSLFVFYLKSKSNQHLTIIVKIENKNLSLLNCFKGTIPINKIRQREIFYNKMESIYVL